MDRSCEAVQTAKEAGIAPPSRFGTEAVARVLGLRTEVVVGEEDGVPRQSAIRCDFLTLMFKSKLTGFVATLSAQKQLALKQALSHALQLR